MLVLDFVILRQLPAKINQNQIPKNTPSALGAALVAFGIFFVVALSVSFLLQSTAFLSGDVREEGAVQSILSHGFAATGLDSKKPIFADSKFLTYYQFAFIIPIIETRMLIRLMEALSTLFGVSLERFGIRLAGIYAFLGYLFVLLHSNVKGVEDNTALLMTFIFAIITFELARRGNKLFQALPTKDREMESATWLHIINNGVFIFNKIGF